MTPIDPSVWQNLMLPTGDSLVARLPYPEKTRKLYCALDARMQRHLLIPIDPDSIEYYDANSRGINVITRELVIHGQLLNRYIDIQCLDASGHEIFDLIGSEIANNLESEIAQPPDVVKRVLAKWRRFWGNIPKHVLSKNEQIGLFAELWFLSVWLIPRLGPNVITAWRGPWGSRHDFEWIEKSVEVKATTNTRGRIFEIHGLSQLENPSRGPLFLFGMRLREEVSSVNNLPALIETLRSQIASSDEIINRFESALAQIGYSPLHDDEYEKLKLRVLEDILFQVDSDFPRLTNATFPAGMPSGIEQIEYEINLNTFDHLVVATSPELLDFV